MKNLFCVLSLSILFTVSFLSNAHGVFGDGDGGHTTGNGGDGIVDTDGNVVMRDFIVKGQLRAVEDNQKFLNEVAGFRELLKDIGSANPMLALTIWEDLSTATIWVTDKKLPLLPKDSTAVISNPAGVQIAIRVPDGDIIISNPAFERSNKEYVMLHEALHKLVDGEGGMHHERVRALVSYFKNNRGNFGSVKSLNRILSKFDVEISGLLDPNESLFYTFWSSEGNLSDLYARGLDTHEENIIVEILKVLVLEQGNKDQKCALYNEVGNSIMGYKSLSTWGNFASCGIPVKREYNVGRDFSNVMNGQGFDSYREDLSSNRLRSISSGMRVWYCQSYANPESQVDLNKKRESYLLEAKLYSDAMVALSTAMPTELNSKIEYLLLMRNSLPTRYQSRSLSFPGYESLKGAIENAYANSTSRLNRNIESCKSVVGSDYMKRR